MPIDGALLVWGEERGLVVRIDRRTRWGNPFEIGKHGHRAEVLEQFRGHLDRRPDLIAALPSLRGRILACWCYPKPCQGDVLCERP